MAEKVSVRAERVRADLQGVADQLPAYTTARPVISLSTGIALARQIRDLALQVEELQRYNPEAFDGS